MSLRDNSPGLDPAKAWYLTFVLFLAYVVGQIDRQVMVMLAGEMKRALLFSDEQLGLLMGLAFSLPYAVGALLFASLAPKIGRKKTLLGAIFIWSLLTMSCALLKSFPGLVMVRLVIGLCEGCLAPTALPMVSAAFPAERRSMPIALCTSGTSIGSLVAPITTGFIISAMAGHQFGPFPLVGIVHGWQTAFLIAGSIGFVVMALLLTTKEAKDGDSGGLHDKAVEPALLYFRRYWKFYFAILVAVPLAGAPGLAVLIWLPAYLERTFALEPKDVGTMITIATIPATLVGPFLGGIVGKFTTRLSDARRRFDIVLTLVVICSGLFALPLLMPTALACVIMYGVMLLVMTVHILLGIINCQQLVPSAYRGQAAATFLSVQIAGGVGLGSFAVGLLATRVVGEGALHLAVLLLIAMVLPLVAAALVAARREKFVPTLDHG